MTFYIKIIYILVITLGKQNLFADCSFLLFIIYQGTDVCESFAVRYNGNETLTDNAKNVLGHYKYVGDKRGTNGPVFVLYNSTTDSLIWNHEEYGWTGAVDIMHS